MGIETPGHKNWHVNLRNLWMVTPKLRTSDNGNISSWKQFVCTAQTCVTMNTFHPVLAINFCISPTWTSSRQLFLWTSCRIRLDHYITVIPSRIAPQLHIYWTLPCWINVAWSNLQLKHVLWHRHPCCYLYNNWYLSRPHHSQSCVWIGCISKLWRNIGFIFAIFMIFAQHNI